MRRNEFSAIEAFGLRKVFGRKVAVADLTLNVGKGEVFGFLGPNGAGKTTAIKMLMSLIRPSAGHARILSKPLGDLTVREKVGFLPEQFRFHEWLRADEFLNVHGQLYGMSQEDRRKRVPEVLSLVGLSARAGDKLRTYSKGMLQRIGLAQALLNNPQVVFLDEPTSALDPLGRREVRDIIKSLKAQGVTVFLNSHLLSEIEMVCDRVAIIDEGRVIRQGTLDELLGAQLEVELRIEGITPELRNELNELAQVTSADGSVITLQLRDNDQIPKLAEAVIAKGGRLYSLIPKHLSLEDLFVKLVKGGTGK